MQSKCQKLVTKYQDFINSLKRRFPQPVSEDSIKLFEELKKNGELDADFVGYVILTALSHDHLDYTHEILQYIKKHNLPIHIDTPEFDTPYKCMYFAFLARDRRTVEVLLDLGADLNSFYRNGNNIRSKHPLIEVIKNQNPYIDFIFADDVINHTAFKADAALIEKIIKHAANDFSRLINSALKYAKKNNLKLDPNAVSSVLTRLLSINSKAESFAETVNLLIEFGAKPLFQMKERMFENDSMFLLLAHSGIRIEPIKNVKIAENILSLDPDYFPDPRTKFALALAYLMISNIKTNEVERLKGYCLLGICGEKGLYKNLSIQDIKKMIGSRFKNAIHASGLIAYLEDFEQTYKANRSYNDIDWGSIYLAIESYENALRCFEMDNNFYEIAKLCLTGYNDKLPIIHLAYRYALKALYADYPTKASHSSVTPALVLLEEEFAKALNFTDAQFEVGKAYCSYHEKYTNYINKGLYYLKLAADKKHEEAEQLYFSILCGMENQVYQVYIAAKDGSKVAREVLENASNAWSKLALVMLDWEKENVGLMSFNPNLATLSFALLRNLLRSGYQQSIEFAEANLLNANPKMMLKILHELLNVYRKNKAQFSQEKIDLIFQTVKKLDENFNEDAIQLLMKLYDHFSPLPFEAKLNLISFLYEKGSIENVVKILFEGDHDDSEMDKMKLMKLKTELLMDEQMRSHLKPVSLFNILQKQEFHIIIHCPNLIPTLIKETIENFEQGKMDRSSFDVLIPFLLKTQTKAVEFNLNDQELYHGASIPNNSAQFHLACQMLANPEYQKEAIDKFLIAKNNGHLLSSKIFQLLTSSSKMKKLKKHWEKLEGSSLIEHIKRFLIKTDNASKNIFKKMHLFKQAKNPLLEDLLNYLDSNSYQSNAEIIIGLEKFVELSSAKNPEAVIKNPCLQAISFIVLHLLQNKSLVEKALLPTKK